MARLTPVQRLPNGVYLKRDDYYQRGGVRGGKVRTCWHLMRDSRHPGFVTAGSRSSPQVNIVAHLAKLLGKPCRCHTPEGELSPELVSARECGAEIIQHKAGYNNVIVARAMEDAKARGWQNIPFGMECVAAVDRTAAQVENIPKDIKRLVVPVGSGMSLAGILHGLQGRNRILPVLGVRVGADPTKRLNTYAPRGFGWDWRNMPTVKVELLTSAVPYHKPYAESVYLGWVELDAHYEAKCTPHLRPGDCLWVVGIRETQKA